LRSGTNAAGIRYDTSLLEVYYGVARLLGVGEPSPPLRLSLETFILLSHLIL